MSRSDDQKRLEFLKSRLTVLEREQKKAIISEIMRRKEAEKADEEDPLSIRLHMPLNSMRNSILSNSYSKIDYDALIKQCKIEISELEDRLSHTDLHNFMNDALNTAGSVEHVSGRWYSYNDKNNGCLKAIIILFVICGVFTLIDLLVSGVLD